MRLPAAFVCADGYGVLMSRPDLRGLLFAEQFVLSAGCVLIRRSTREVIVLRKSNGQHMLPKGRKGVRESLGEAATRETYEIGHTADKPRRETDAVEPIAITVRGTDDDQKHIYWFVAEMDESRPKEEGTQMGNESYTSHAVPFEKVLDVLTFDDDKAVTARALDLYIATYNIE